MVTPFKWTPRRRQAVPLVADDLLTDAQIAAACGVTRQALVKWRAHPDFQAAVEELQAKARAGIERKHIAEKDRRVQAAVERHRKMERVIAERASSPLMEGVPGGQTGLIVAKPMLVKVYESRPVSDLQLEDGGDGVDFKPDVLDDRDYLDSVKRSVIEYEYAVDTALLKEMRETEKQVAIELGEWSEKRDHRLDAEAFLDALREFGRGDSGG